MKNKKYIPCNGLAFSDREDMEILHQYALEGWIFREYRLTSYVLYKEEPQDIIFSYDMNTLKKGDEDDYYRFFEEAGWHRISNKNKEIHFFYATNGTAAIHSDSKTRIPAYQEMFRVSLIICIVGLILFLVAYYFREHNFMLPIAMVGGACVGGGGMSLLGAIFRIKQKRLRCVVLPFKKSLYCACLGLLMMAVCYGLWSRSPIWLFGLCIVFYGVSSAILQYPLYRDKKEIKRKTEETL